MSRKLFILATSAFWLVVIALGVTSLIPEPERPIVEPERPIVEPAKERTIALAELAGHATPADCWMAIRGGVYDLSAYLPEHPSRPEIVLPWCGREATEAYDTKMKGRRHSQFADELLEKYRLGVVR